MGDLMLPVLLTIFTLLALAWLATAYWASNLLLHGKRRPLTCTPRDYGLAYEDVTFAGKDALALRGWWIPASPAARQEQSPAVILLHPLFGNRQGAVGGLDLLELARCRHAAGYAVLLFDFRNHGESQSGLGAGGYSEDQDVAGAVDYVFARLATESPEREPQVGLVGFGLGAAAAVTAIGREKGDSRTIRVFNADQEGSSGFVEFPAANVKKLRFLVAVAPAAPRALLCEGCRLLRSPLGPLLIPLADYFCRRRSGYPLDGALLRGFARHVHTPTLYVHTSGATDGADEAQRLYAAISGPKQMCCIEGPLNPQAVYAHAAQQPEQMLAFAKGKIGD